MRGPQFWGQKPVHHRDDVLGGAVAVQEEFPVEEVESDRPVEVPEVQVGRAAGELRGHGVEHRLGEVLVGVDHDQRRPVGAGGGSLHHLCGDVPEERRLAAPGLGHDQLVAVKERRGQVDGNRAALGI